MNRTYIVIISLLLSSCSIANEKCLEFIEGIEKNHVKNYLKKHQFRKSIVDKGKFYSSSYDLNDDNKYEFFYYFEGLSFCGKQTGCSVHINEHINNTFVSRAYPSIHPFGKFNPKKASHIEYICVLNNKTNGWNDLKIDDRYTMKYNGNTYKRVENKEEKQ